MDDLEICKKIAEIDGATSLLIYRDGSVNATFDKPSAHDRTVFDYNPLTDDALCFKFVTELELRVMHAECPAGSGKAYFVSNGINQTDYFDTPNKAVCMAKLGFFDNEL